MAIKLSDFLEILQGGVPTTRLIDNELFEELRQQGKAHWQRPDMAVLFTAYLDKTPLFYERFGKYLDCEVVHFDTIHEVTHKQYKEKGLLPPFKPELMAEYDFKEIQQKTYYDIYINTEAMHE